MKKAIAEIEAKGLGKGKVNFRLRDAVFGRQRYWGEPIPVYYKNDIPYALNENELPLVLPEVDKYLPTEDGEPPLARAASSWKHEGKYDYEHSTMPGWAGSSWYFLRYMDPKNSTQFVGKQLADYWQNVDLYIGGSEHATGHLLYVRFWTKFLKDLGYIAVDEPAKKLINQGMIQGLSMVVNVYYHKDENMEENESITYLCPKDIKKDQLESIGQVNFPVDFVKFENGKYFIDDEVLSLSKNKFPHLKNFYLNAKAMMSLVEFNDSFDKIEATPLVEKMSKSKWNVVSPDDIAEQFGADTLRMYEMFLGPLEQSKPWNTNGITGVHGFLKKLWKLAQQTIEAEKERSLAPSPSEKAGDEAASKAELKTLHKTIKKITEDIERFSFNTSISNFMICVNELTDAKCNKKAILEPLLICLSPYAPHITEELWKQLGHTESIATAPFPEFNEAYLVDDNVNYPVSFNGKVKFTLELPATLTGAEVEAIVRANENTVKFLDGKEPKKVIVVPGRIVNMVV